MTKHLKFDGLWAFYNKVEQEHPLKVMKKLGITYQHSTPQSMSDQWQFWNCENIPSPLPPYLSVLERNPMDSVGYGLSQEEAENIRDYNNPDKTNKS